MMHQKPQGIAFYCQDSGLITEVITDDLEIITGAGKGVGKLFQNMIDEASRNRAFEFLVAIKANKIAFDYQLNLLVHQEIRTLYFMGISISDKILIIGANNHKDVVEFTNRMQEIGNEQANLIRSLIKEQYRPAIINGDASIYDEISKLNNELVNLQRELTRKNIELHKLNELKNTFLGMAAHDLRNPIGVILGYSDFLLDDLENKLSADQIKMLNTIQQSSEFMLNLLEALLDITAIESGRLVLELQKADLLKLVTKNASLNGVIAAKKNILISVEALGPIPEVRIDVSKIEQVLNNLVSNAIKFSMPGTLVKINLCLRGEHVIVCVADQGQGIPPGEMDKLFKPFQRTSVRATAGEKSTGLGLSIVRNIITGHGGEIWVESEPGKGSTFYFSIPCLHDDKK